jgi:hypothetical protein
VANALVALSHNIIPVKGIVTWFPAKQEVFTGAVDKTVIAIIMTEWTAEKVPVPKFLLSNLPVLPLWPAEALR